VRTQLVASVVQCFVKGAACRVETFGEDVDRHLVQCQGNEYAPLMRGQHLADCRLQGRKQFALLGLLIGCEPDACKQAPGIWLERDLAALPGTLAQLDGRLEQGELVNPGRETAFAAKVVAVRENADQRVASGLTRDLLKLVTQVGEAAAAARRLEACGAQEQRV